MVLGVASAFSESCGLALEEDRMVGLGDEYEASENDSRPDEKNVESPSPCRKLIDKASYHRTQDRTKERCYRIQYHRCLNFTWNEKIRYSATCNRKESTAGNTIQESPYEHRLDILRSSAGYDEHEEKEHRGQVYGSPSIKLDSWLDVCTASEESK